MENALITRDGEEETEFDGEAEERDAGEIEQIIQEFVDEPPVYHDEYPETETDEEEDEEGEVIQRQRRRRHVKRGDGRLYRDQTFFNGVAFKEAVVDYALRTGRNLKQYRYDKDKIGFKCVCGDGKGEGEGCYWQVYASVLPKDCLWKVRVFVDKHTCVPNGECEMLKVPIIARLFMDKIREEPEYYMPLKIEEVIKEKWGITVSRPQCQAARNKALRWIESEYDHQFARLRDYAAEIRLSNENSVVEIDTVKNDKGEDLFDKFYVCFDVLRKTWKETCRPLIGVDGCFLKEKLKGQFLVALGRDADNALYPIAWAVVQVENKDNWLWFISDPKLTLFLYPPSGD